MERVEEGVKFFLYVSPFNVLFYFFLYKKVFNKNFMLLFYNFCLCYVDVMLVSSLVLLL